MTLLATETKTNTMNHLFSNLIIFILFSNSLQASHLLIPMDEDSQNDHLKAYGIAFWSLENNFTVDWLLNYRGGSFLIENQLN